MGNVVQLPKKSGIDPQYKDAIGIVCTFKQVTEENSLVTLLCRLTNERPTNIEVFVEDPSDVIHKDIRDKSDTHGQVIFHIGGRGLQYMHMNYTPGETGVVQCMLTRDLTMAKELHQILGWSGQAKTTWRMFTAT